MARYVDLDELRAGVDATNWYHIRDGKLMRGARSDLEPLYKVADIVELVDSLETADVAPVVHAHWIERNDRPYLEGLFECSNCSEFNGWRSTYCPDCGAKMDEEE